MTLGDLLRQDGALALLAIGAVLGFFAAMFFRARTGGKENPVPESALPASAHVPLPGPAGNKALIAAVTAAVNKYRAGDV